MRLLPALLVALTAPPLTAQSYERRELSIPMRDGVTLHAVALIPAGATPLPILLVRTPFGAARELPGPTPPRAFAELAKDGYVIVVQDIRGRGTSGGSFITMRPLAASAGTDESTDAWDTIDWLVGHLPNNGRVGVLGLSYRGWLAGMAGIAPHPALKAISPQAPMVDAWMGDDFFHQGAFRQTMGVLYSGYIEGDGVDLPEGPEYDTYLRYPTLEALARAAGVDTLPSWSGFRAHPGYDEFWHSRALQHQLTRSRVPTLIVGGFWDDEDLVGAQLLFRTLSGGPGAELTHLVMGPWSHTTIVRGAGDSLGPIALGAATATWFHAEVERPWFAYHLHGKGSGRFPRAWVYETGANVWRSTESWPARATAPRKLYLQADGKLSFTPPTTSGAACDPYTSDPARPVPHAPAEGGAANWLLNDQRFLAGRTDVVSWRSEPLTADLVLTGDVAAQLFASTSGTDADWVVKLIDAFPDSAGTPGYQLMVNGDILRGRYWRGFDHATPIPADSVLGYTIDLHPQQYRFRKGHRLMVQVHSTWFPMYDRNPQRFVPNIFAARATDYQSARHCIWRSAEYPSHLTLSAGTDP